MCDLCGITLSGPCGVICLTDCSICWVAVTQTAERLAPSSKLDVERQRAVRFDRSTPIRICTTDLGQAELGAFLQSVLPIGELTAREGEGRARTGTLSGTAEEVIAALGFAPPDWTPHVEAP